MADASVEFKVRLGQATDEDRNYARGTLLQSFRRRGRGPSDTDADSYFSGHHEVVERLFARGAKLWIAHPRGDPDHIVGYALCEPRLLHYVYVRESHRTKPGSPVGVASLLLKAVGQFDAYTHDTVDWRAWVRPKFPLAKFAPYLVAWPYSPEKRDAERAKAAERSRVRVRR